MSPTDKRAASVSNIVVALGLAVAFLGVAWDLLRGRPLGFGLEQSALVLAGVLLAIGGVTLRRPVLARPIAAVLAESDRRTEAFLSDLRGRPLFYPRLGLWLGMTAGLAESGRYFTLLGERAWLPALWLAPVVYGVLYGLIGAGVALIARRSPSRHRLDLALAPLLSILIVSWLFMLAPRMHVAASILLGVGLATRLTVPVVRHAHVLGTLARRTEIPVWVAVLALTTWSFAGPAYRESEALSALPSPPEGARSVLLLVLDTVRARSLGLYGYERANTPALSEWSRRGTLFESAMSTAPWTLPSHAGMFTGRWAFETSADWTIPLDDAYPTIAEAMAAEGFVTAGFVGNLAYVSRIHGLGRGFLHYDDFEVGLWQGVLSTVLGRRIVTGDWIRNTLGYHELVNRKHAADVNESLLDWLDDVGERPFFAFVNYFDAHEPYMPPEPYRTRFAPGVEEPRGPYSHSPNQADRLDWWEMSPEQVEDEQALYDAAIAYLDHEIGELVSELERRGLLASTTVIVTADHGEHFGEHGLFMHGNNLYLPQVRVPLLLLVPDRGGPDRVSETVSLRDIPSTVLDLAHAGAEHSFAGSSLTRFLTSASAGPAPDTLLFKVTGGFGPAPTPLSKGDMWSVVVDPYQYIVNGDGTEELYDYRADPEQLLDLAATGTVPGVLAGLRSVTSARRPPR